MVLGARKVGAEARARYAEDTEKAQQLPELLEAARKAEEELLRARREGADVVELNRLGVAYDAALTEAMRAAYAHQRVLMPPRLRGPHLPAASSGPPRGEEGHGSRRTAVEPAGAAPPARY